MKGALIALALDLTLRSAGLTTLDDVMRALWERHGKPGSACPKEVSRPSSSELAAVDMTDFFDRHVRGTADLPLAELLAPFGVE